MYGRDNLDIAESAQEIAEGSPTGSLDQAAAKSVAITCATTRTASDARAALSGVGPPEVRVAALALFERLTQR